jgi:uncharacterized membrane-anchored protein YhcB (DUF1043 family)
MSIASLDFATAAALVGALALGFGLGMLGNRGRRRVQELQARLESAHKERERAEAELAAAREVVERERREHEEYRGQVTEHFAGTSERLRDLTVQYRAVYEHLAEGASVLCPESFVGLEGGFEALALRAGQPEEPERSSGPASS